MLIVKYGLTLRSILNSDLATVRKWRNSDHVRKHMHFRRQITNQMQQEWFQKLDAASSLYLIIEREGQQAGLINLKEIDHSNKIAEAGIFIGNVQFINTMIPVLATIALMEFAFEVLKLEKLIAKMDSTNSKIIEFNKALGYIEREQQNDHTFHYFETEKDRFYNSTSKLRMLLNKLNKDGTKIRAYKKELELLSINSKSLIGKGLNFQLQD